MKKHNIHTYIFVGISFFVILGSFYLNIVEWYRTPPGTTYTFTFGHDGDFNQILYFIKSGTEGQLLYKIPYTDLDPPPLLLHSLYYISGFVLSPFIKSPVLILYILRILSLSIFLTCLIKLIRTVFHTFTLQLTAFILSITSTSVWSTTVTAGQTIYTIPISWNDTFYAWRKFIILPHHFLAITAIMLLLLTMAKMPWTKRSTLTASVLTLALASLNPYHLLFMVCLTILYGCTLWILKKQQRASIATMVASIVIPASITFGFYAITIGRILPQEQPKQLEALLRFHQSIPFFTYILALGPTVFLSLLFFFPLVARKVNRLAFLLFLWFLIPLLIFEFADIGVMQPLKIQQYIPLALLTTFGVQYLINRSKVFLILIPLLIGGSVFYTSFPYLATCYQAHTEHYETYFNVYIPTHLTKTFTYLDTHTPEGSIVMAGSLLSMLIPTYTHNFVFIGQRDSVFDYDQRVMSVVNFYSQNMDSETMKQFLRTHHISYIVFNIDAPSYTGKFMEYPFLKEVYKNEFNSVVQVQL